MDGYTESQSRLLVQLSSYWSGLPGQDMRGQCRHIVEAGKKEFICVTRKHETTAGWYYSLLFLGAFVSDNDAQICFLINVESI